MSLTARTAVIVLSLLATWFLFQQPFVAFRTSSASVVARSATLSRLSDQNCQSRSGWENLSSSPGNLDVAVVSFSQEVILSRVIVAYVNARMRGRKLLFGIRSCVSQDLTLTQGPVVSTSGIPTFSVQIINLCGACAMSKIHVACGDWASATPVDPFVFSRLGYNDCLVNNGLPLSSQGTVTFQYSNSAMYPMSISSADNECQP